MIMPDPTLGELFTQVMQQIPSSQEVNAKYTKPAGGIPGTDLASGVIPDTSGFLTQHQDISGKADKTDTVLTHSLSMGRKENTTIADNTVAMGYQVTASAAQASAFGDRTQALAPDSHAEGSETIANNYQAHAEGHDTFAAGQGSHAEGYGTRGQYISTQFHTRTTLSNGILTPGALGNYSHSEGGYTSAVGKYSHAEGSYNVASKENAHVEGYYNVAAEEASHAEGYGTTAVEDYAHSEGYETRAAGIASHAEGYNTLASGPEAHAEGYSSEATGNYSHAEGYHAQATGSYSHAEGIDTLSTNNASHAEGSSTQATGQYSHVEGQNTKATASYAHAEGDRTRALAQGAHAEGLGNGDSYVTCSQYKNKDRSISNDFNLYPGATGIYAHAEGGCNQASNSYTHAEGQFNVAAGETSHAEGMYTYNEGMISHTEGYYATILGNYNSQACHAEGYRTLIDNAYYAHAEGEKTIVTARAAHAEGEGTMATGRGSHVGGMYNIPDSYDNWTAWAASTAYKVGDKVKVTTTSNNITTIKGYICKTAHTSGSVFSAGNWNEDTNKNYVFIIGNGSDNNHRSNAFAIKWDGSVQEGSNTTASGQFSHAEGGGTTASGSGSHAEGASTIASGLNAHAEGNVTTASGQDSHAEGTGTKATNGESHAEGIYTTASGSSAHSEGTNTVAAGSQSHAEGLGGTYTDNGTTKYYGAYGTADHVEGFHTLTADGMPGNHAEGYQTKATGGGAHSEGSNTKASGNSSHAEGSSTDASGYGAHAEGNSTTASQSYAHAEGNVTTASNYCSHAEGDHTTASGAMSHAEGSSTTAKAPMSHVEGTGTIAAATNSHVGGMFNIEDSYISWPEWTTSTSYEVGDKVKVTTIVNNETTIKGYICKTANSDAKFTATKWNEDYYMNYALIIGNGKNDSNRSNAFTIGWDGSVQEGSWTAALGKATHAEGNATIASGDNAHAEGNGCSATAAQSHAEGRLTQATSQNSHAEGISSQAQDEAAHAEGNNTIASGPAAHSEGNYTRAVGQTSHAEGQGGLYTENGITKYYGAYGTADHVEGYQTLTADSRPGNHAEGYQTKATGGSAHSEGHHTTASGLASHAEGNYTIAIATGSHVGGTFNVEDSYASWAEWVASTSYTVGDKVKVTTTIDNETTVTGYICKTANSDAEFTATKWTLDDGYNYVEIIGNGASANARSNARALDWDGNEHLMGDVYVGCNADSTGGTKLAKITDIPTAVDTSTLAPKANPVFTGSISMGRSSTGSTGEGSVALGYNTKASGMFSFAIGSGTDASGYAQFVCGQYNKYEGNGKWLFIVGNGTSSASSQASNAFTVHNNGNGYFNGDVYANCAADTSNGSKLATESFVTTRVPAPPVADGNYTLQVSVSSGVATYSWVSLPVANGVSF